MFAFLLIQSNLDDQTRQLALEEVDHDVAAGTLYMSRRFTEEGNANYKELLREALRDHDDEWLAAELRRRGYFQTHEERRSSKTGKVSQVRVPVTAADTLAEGEFNRFYMRGVCRRAINEGIAEVVIYRAKEVEQPRPESEARRGQRVSAEALLNDLRNSPGVDTALGLPTGPNSGLSVHLS